MSFIVLSLRSIFIVSADVHKIKNRSSYQSSYLPFFIHFILIKEIDIIHGHSSYFGILSDNFINQSLTVKDWFDIAATHIKLPIYRLSLK